MNHRRPAQFLARHWPCAAALGLLALAGAALTAIVLRGCEGRLVYPLDDTYIHMAVARTLARHGVWGLTPFGFTSCSSSLLWPLALALTWLATGVRESTPLLLNFLFAGLLLANVWALHRRLGHPAWYGFLSLFIVIGFTPLPTMAMLGMEHVLHALLAVAFIGVVAELLEGKTVETVSLNSRALPPALKRGANEMRPLLKRGANEMRPLLKRGANEMRPLGMQEAIATRHLPLATILLAPLLTAVRYESGFILAAACLLLACRRRWLLAAGLGVAGLAPLMVFGLVSKHFGWSFFPNSVLIKAGLAGSTVDVPGLTGASMVGYMVNHQHLLVPLILTLAAVVMRVQATKNPWEPAVAFGILTILAAVPLFATLRPSLFGRYDAFLDCFGLTALMLNLPGAAAAFRGKQGSTSGDAPATRPPAHASFVSSPWFIPAVLLISLPLLAPMAWRFSKRAYYSTLMVGPGSRNIYEQQYQMGRFVKRYYAGRAVAVNDIGAVSFFGDIDCFDIYGLGSAEVMRARLEKRYSPQTLARLAAGRKVAVGLFYEHWVEGIPAEWQKAGQWTNTDCCVLGGDTVSFYAAAPGELEPLKQHLREFKKQLPKRVIQGGEYLKD